MRSKALAAVLILCLACAAGAAGETVQHGVLRVAFSGSLKPKKLPREGSAPITVELGGRIFTEDGSNPPVLRRIELAINKHGYLDPKAVPTCNLEQIQPASTAYARRVCGAALVGEGSFSAAVAVPEQTPYPSDASVTAFNGVEDGRPVVFLHVYGTEPLPTSFTLPLRIVRGKGNFGTVLRGSLPFIDSGVAFVTGLSVTLDGGSRRKPYLSAGCPAPKGFSGAPFPLARASFSFAGGTTLSSTLVRSCKVRR